MSDWDGKDWGAFSIATGIIVLFSFGFYDIVANAGAMGRSGPIGGIFLGCFSVVTVFRALGRGSFGDEQRSGLAQRPVVFWSMVTLLMVFGIGCIVSAIAILGRT